MKMAFLALALATGLLCGSRLEAREFQLTVYDDGYACPGNCNAHAVFNDVENGTRYAHSPESSRASPHKCLDGRGCTVCFSDADASCMEVLYYAGGGPVAGRFDFTLAFYQENCGRADVPVELKSECAALAAAVREQRFDRRLNCFLDRDDVKCRVLMNEAEAAQGLDEPKRKECIRRTEPVYNAAQTDPRERRKFDCNYSEMRLGGTPSHPAHRLMPGSCPTGHLVGQHGYDCCSADPRFAAADGDECLPFFPFR